MSIEIRQMLIKSQVVQRAASDGAGTDPAPWAAAGATWVLTQVGPYRMDLAEVREVVAAGP